MALFLSWYRFRLLGALWAPAVLCLVAPASGSRPDEKNEEEPGAKQAKAYRALFEKAGRKGLTKFTEGKDLSLALQAAWELNKQLDIAPDAKVGAYTEAGTKKFLKFLTDRTKAPVPDWWSNEFLSLLVRNDFHRISQRAETPAGKKVEIGKREWLVGEGVTLRRAGDDLSFESGGLSLKYPSNAFTVRSDAFADAIGEKYTCLAAYNTNRSDAFKVVGFENKGGKRLWTAAAWALDCQILLGPSAHHRAELVIGRDVVFVFGSEAGGLYVEAFELTSGKCRFRFCSCYWRHWSDNWNIK